MNQDRVTKQQIEDLESSHVPVIDYGKKADNGSSVKPKAGDQRIKDGIAITCIAYGDGYVMWRYAATYPWIMTLRTWESLQEAPRQQRMGIPCES